MAVLEHSRTSIVLFRDAQFSAPCGAFTLLTHSHHPLIERLLPQLAWTPDGAHLCALTTHGQLFCLTGARTCSTMQHVE